MSLKVVLTRLCLCVCVCVVCVRVRACVLTDSSNQYLANVETDGWAICSQGNRTPATFFKQRPPGNIALSEPRDWLTEVQTEQNEETH